MNISKRIRHVKCQGHLGIGFSLLFFSCSPASANLTEIITYSYHPAIPPATMVFPSSTQSSGARKRRALSILERKDICRKRLEPQHAKSSLAAFGKLFPDMQV